MRPSNLQLQNVDDEALGVRGGSKSAPPDSRVWNGMIFERNFLSSSPAADFHTL